LPGALPAMGPTATEPTRVDVPPSDLVRKYRNSLNASRASLQASFVERPDTSKLLRESARVVDRAIAAVWRELSAPAEMALVAVGGYGRGQLFPHSDVDILILLPAALDAAGTAFIERFVGMLWDIGLDAGHSVRTIAECEAEMAGDITITTSLLEHRLVAGSRPLFRRFGRAVALATEPRHFYEAKMLEQQQRHLKYHDTAYNLEPNLKESPGGLRDLQTVLWIARAAGLGRSWRDLAQAGLITMQEARTVSRQERFIGALRIRLHYLAGRREDRLVFDLQNALARELRLADTASRRASEQLMQRYYRAAKLVRQVNVILLQNLHSRLFPIPT
jgi:[protein-PII] uridylyltransferase